jgi:ParB family chromosome partitioning protein
MAKRKSLGRGLDALLSQAGPSPAAAGAGGNGSELSELPIDLLDRGRYQPRVDMREDSLAELAESIRAQGIVQPIVVTARRSADRAGGCAGAVG